MEVGYAQTRCCGTAELQRSGSTSSSLKDPMRYEHGLTPRRRDMPKNYEQVHWGLLYIRGRACDHPCVGCGRPGQAWAYQHNSGEDELYSETGAPYSENLLDHYASMCLSCHVKLDKSPEQMVALGARGREVQAQLMQSDPEWAEARRQRSRDALRKGRVVKEELMKDPEWVATHREELRLNAVNARAAFTAQRLADPSVTDPLREAGRRVSLMRRTCEGCGKESNPAGMGLHQRASGHVGWVAV